MSLVVLAKSYCSYEDNEANCGDDNDTLIVVLVAIVQLKKRIGDV